MVVVAVHQPRLGVYDVAHGFPLKLPASSFESVDQAIAVGYDDETCGGRTFEHRTRMLR